MRVIAFGGTRSVRAVGSGATFDSMFGATRAGRRSERAETANVRTARLVSVAGLVLVGVALAWPFRRDWQDPPGPAESPPVVDVPLRGPDVAVAVGPAGEESPALGAYDKETN